ncbi:hypothetical protein MASR1M90_23910 [Desulfovibrionales bacterium]
MRAVLFCYNRHKTGNRQHTMTTKFQKGKSGNPSGRPKGSGIGPKLRQAIAEQSEELVQSVLDQAKAGDMQAAKLLLDRILPPLKPESLAAVDVPGDASRLDLAKALLGAVLLGEISVDGAKEVLALAKEKDNAQSDANFKKTFGDW